ncbi:hypothetical protein ACRE_089080 [Hapsidospora chrysogenum ATCC 11550]|uniref:Uncharacterized protein n=1 Tax=Hapsidospora chrysogenum (strain ATCC 11550 / CBS 779.69 / DSM 880 / IAM 14645 / JCM 23072 / IMI 49137) TaxID=857340 RepID=A0A086STI9_HAPC1|nr:hypothetical protein ACRE_089080 [Hapsidospora chrysogenum ATCC 11550]
MSYPADLTPLTHVARIPPVSPHRYRTGQAMAMECGGHISVGPVPPTVPPPPSTNTPLPKTPDTPAHASESQQTQTISNNLNPKPARRKLRKSAPRPKALSLDKRGAKHSTASPTAVLECGGGLASPPSSYCERPSIPMSPSLGDSKWLQYIERSGLVNSSELPLGLGSKAKGAVAEPPHSSSSLTDEFSNLSLRNRTTWRSSSLDRSPSPSLRPPTMPRPRRSISKLSLMAPPLKIGQLDGSAPRRKEIRVIKKRASIELIAEQYQAFLESRDAGDGHESDYDEELAEDTVRLEPTQYDGDHGSSRQGSLDRPREVILESPGPAEPNNLSPASDGTLVAFEEDAIYFKPVSFSSPEPSPRAEQQTFDKPLPKPPTDAGNQPLQACITMLVKELTSAMPRQQSTPGDNSQVLQISVMIEAYERLRDQVETMGMGDAEQRSVRSMFDCWLAALHTMHRSYSRYFPVSERQCEDLAEEVD